MMTGLEIAALFAMLGGAALQYKSTTDASKRAEQETLRSLSRQDEFNKQAEKKALTQASEFNTDNRAAQQAEIESQLAQEFIAPVESAQAINSKVATTQGDVSGDYSRAKAESDLNVIKNARNLAGLLSKTTSASRLRGNEAIRMADTASGIDRLGSFARGTGAADQIAIQAAGRPDAGMQLAGGVLSAVGGYGLSGGFSGAAGSAGSGVTGTASTSMSPGAQIVNPNTGVGFSGVGTTGLKIPKSMQWSF